MSLGPNTRKRWLEAALDLHLEIAEGFNLEEVGGTGVVDCVVVRSFGAAFGTILVNDSRKLLPYFEKLREVGYTVSSVAEPIRLEEYSRSVACEVLSDWGWTGAPSKRPAWAAQAKEE
jgi:hypothetical protein